MPLVRPVDFTDGGSGTSNSASVLSTGARYGSDDPLPNSQVSCHQIEYSGHLGSLNGCGRNGQLSPLAHTPIAVDEKECHALGPAAPMCPVRVDHIRDTQYRPRGTTVIVYMMSWMKTGPPIDV
jgi:hypothetical protein